ncbi:MAG: DMT family transporter [Phycisphaerales bacterium]|nr:DMT family transporter [Phycisphaerales bacterium]
MRERGVWGRFGGAVTIVATLVGWSSVPLFLKHFSHLIDPWTSNGWRYGFSALLWLPVLVWGVTRRTLPPGLWAAAVIPAALNAGSQTVFCYAHYAIDPGLLTFGLRSNIVFTTLGAALFFAAERRVIRRPGFLVGLLMVIGGTAGTMLLGTGVLEGATLAGVLMAIASGAGFAAYSLAVRHFMHGVNAFQAFAAISLYTAVGTTVLMVAFGDRHGAAAWPLVHEAAAVGGWPIPGGQMTMLLLSAVIGIALGHVFYYYSIQRLGVAVSAGVIQLQPFLVAVASLSLFGERLSLQQWVSGCVAVVGAGVILWAQRAAAGRPSSGAAGLKRRQESGATAAGPRGE